MYDDVKFLTVALPEFDFSFGSEVLSFRLPTTWPARLIKIGLAVTVDFACDTTEADIQLGTAADPNAYAELNITDGTTNEDFFDETDDTNAILAADIPAGTLIEVGLNVGTDSGTAAGKGMPMFFFEMYGGE